jgi:hypothetical protein
MTISSAVAGVCIKLRTDCACELASPVITECDSERFRNLSHPPPPNPPLVSCLHVIYFAIRGSSFRAPNISDSLYIWLQSRALDKCYGIALVGSSLTRLKRIRGLPTIRISTRSRVLHPEVCCGSSRVFKAKPGVVIIRPVQIAPTL